MGQSRFIILKQYLRPSHSKALLKYQNMKFWSPAAYGKHYSSYVKIISNFYMRNFFQNDITFLHRGLPVRAFSRSSECNVRKLQRIQLGISKGYPGIYIVLN